MNKRKEGELDLKIVLLGKAYAGKTCLAQRYVNQMFTETPYQNVRHVTTSLKTRKEIWLQTEMYKVILNYD
jgi:GTPase SAR1 family protein